MKESHTGIGICHCRQCRLDKKHCNPSGRKHAKRSINKFSSPTTEIRGSNRAQPFRRILGLNTQKADKKMDGQTQKPTSLNGY